MRQSSAPRATTSVSALGYITPEDMLVGVTRRSTAIGIGSRRRRESSGTFVGNRLVIQAFAPPDEKFTYLSQSSAERRRPATSTAVRVKLTQGVI
jgi:hypothetical protein